MAIARAGYDYAAQNFKAFSWKAPKGAKPLGIITGNQAIAMGGAAAGVKFYAAYPMSPSTGVLMWMAAHARELGIMVRQVEDEIGVMNMVIGAAHTGCRAMCATSGGGFALMTEAVGMAGMIETPIVCVDVQRAGPATGVPTKTEQGDLWQVLGAGQGDYPRIVVAPTNQLDLFQTIPELFNLCDKYQCPGLVLSDLLISEGTASIDPDDLDFEVKIDRGELILPMNGRRQWQGNRGANPGAVATTTRRICVSRTPTSGISPRAVPGVPGHIFTAATDEHDEDGTLDQRRIHQSEQSPDDGGEARPQNGRRAIKDIAPPKLVGPEKADVTLVGWGSTEGVIREAVEKLAGEEGIVANQLADQMDRAAARGGNQPHPRAEQECHRGGEQSERPIRPLSPERNRLRSAWPHPQVRRRTVHAASHCRSRERAIGRQDPPFRSCPRSARMTSVTSEL